MYKINSNKMQADGSRREITVFEDFSEVLYLFRKNNWTKKKVRESIRLGKQYNIDTTGYSYMDCYYTSELELIVEEALFLCWTTWERSNNIGSFINYTKKCWDKKIVKLIDYYAGNTGSIVSAKKRKVEYYAKEYNLTTNESLLQLEEQVAEQYTNCSLDTVIETIDDGILPEHQVSYAYVEEEVVAYTERDKIKAAYILKKLNVSEGDYFEIIRILEGKESNENRVKELEKMIRNLSKNKLEI